MKDSMRTTITGALLALVFCLSSTTVIMNAGSGGPVAAGPPAEAAPAGVTWAPGEGAPGGGAPDDAAPGALGPGPWMSSDTRAPRTVPSPGGAAGESPLPSDTEPPFGGLYGSSMRNPGAAAGGRGTGSRAGPDMHFLGWEADNDVQVGVTVNIEVQVNNTGDAPTSGAVTVDWEVKNHFEKVLHTDQKTISSPIAPGESPTVAFTWAPTEATRAAFYWTVTASGDADTGNDDWSHYYWLPVMQDYTNNGVQSSDWTDEQSPWHITDTIDGDQLTSGSHSAPDAWHCGTNATVDSYDTDIAASLVSIVVDFDTLWYNDEDHYWDGDSWEWSNDRCDEPSEHAWLMFEWFGDATRGPDAQNPLDFWNMTMVNEDTGQEASYLGKRSGDYTSGWYGVYWDCNDNGQYDSDTDVFAINLDPFVASGGRWKFSINFYSDGMIDPGKSGYYFDDFRFLAITENPVEKDCHAWKVGEVGLTEPGVTKSVDVWIRNRAVEMAENVPVKMEVDGSVVDSRTAASVSPDADQKVTMEWTPVLPGRHEVRIYSQLPGDEFPENDELEFSVHAYPAADSIESEVDVLIVDNDHGYNNSGFWPDAEYYFLDAFEQYAGDDEATHAAYNVWLTTPGYGEVHNGPPLDVLENYEYVIWLTGFAYGRELELVDGTFYRQDTFTADDLDNLRGYLRSGEGDEPRNLWTVGQSILFDLQGIVDEPGWNLLDNLDYTTESSTFQRDFLHVDEWTSNSRTAHPLKPHTGPGGDPDCLVWDGPFELGTMHTPFGSFTTGEGTDIGVSVTPHEDLAGETTLMFEGENILGDDVYNAVMYESEDYNSFFFGFEFGCIESLDDRAGVIFDILEYTADEPLRLMMGGDGSSLPGDVVEMGFTMSNPGRRDDAVDARVELRRDGALLDWTTDLKAGDLEDLALPGEGERAFTFNVTVPDDWEDPSVASGSVIVVNVTVTSQNTDVEYYGESNITMGTVTGLLEMEMEDPGGKIDPGKSSRYDIALRYLTNGLVDLTVALEVTGKDRDMVELGEKEVEVPPYDSTRSTTEVSVQAVFTAGEYQHAGEYEFGFRATAVDPNPDVDDPAYENSTAGTAVVKQVYEIDLASPGGEPTEVQVDPNEVDEGADHLIRWFQLEVLNLGNDEDTISFETDNDRKWDAFVLYDEPGSGDDPDDLEDDALDELAVGPAPEEAGLDDDDEEIPPSTSEDIFVAVVILLEDLVEKGSGSTVEITLVALSEDGDQDAELSVFITIVKPELTFGSEGRDVLFNVTVDGAGVDPDRSGVFTVEPGVQLDMKIGIANPGDANVTGVGLRIVITDGDDEELEVIDETVSTLNMGEMVNVTFDWTVPDLEEDAGYLITITLDPDEAVVEEDEGLGSNMFESELFADYVPPPPPDENEGKGNQTPGGSGAVIVAGSLAAVIVAVIAVIMLMAHTRRRRAGRDDPGDGGGEDVEYPGEGGGRRAAVPSDGPARVAIEGGGDEAPEDANGGAVKGARAEGLGGGDRDALGEKETAGLLPPKKE